MPADGSHGPIYSLYADPAYPQSEYILGGFRNAHPGSLEARWNREMSRVRQSVEWGFKEIMAIWKFLHFHKAMKIFQSPVAKYFIVAAWLTNLSNCFYGNQIANAFGVKPIAFSEYIALVDHDAIQNNNDINF